MVNIKDLNEVLHSQNIKKVFGDISKEQKAVLKGIKFVASKNTFGTVMQNLIAGRPHRSVKIIEPIYIKEPGITASKKQPVFY